MPILFPLFAAAAGATVALTDARTVRLDAPRIRLADVARSAGLPRASWDHLAGQVIATLPARSRAVTLSRNAVSVLVSRRMPGIRTLAGATSDPIRFEVSGEQSTSVSLACRALGVARRAGEQMVDADLSPAPCTGAPVKSLQYVSRGRQLVAARDLPAGSYLGRIAAPPVVAVKRGDDLRLVSRMGSVTIERAVTAMQVGRAGKPVFVRDSDGEVFAVRVSRSESIR